VNKDDPQGPIPTDPQSDGQYANWETAVRTWFADYQTKNPDFHETADFTIPTATDNIHVPANFPHVTITSPLNGANLDPAGRATVSLVTTGPYPIQKAELYIDGNYITSSTQAPFTLNFRPEDLSGLQSINTLQVIVYDSVFDQGAATTTFMTSVPITSTSGQ
jgi:hypothetical protein